MGKDLKLSSYSIVENPLKELKYLLSIFKKGLNAPIPFFPKSSYKYAEIMHKKDDDKKAFLEANKIWLKPVHNTSIPEESADHYYNLCFKNSEQPLNSEFKSIAKNIFIPFINSEIV